tara:strand:+ start:90 stop:671 length:582 start_codon:yes stop_codon:yes gene_type:complete
MWFDILKRGASKKIHYESLKEAVITALEENTSNVQVFTMNGLVDVAHDIYWELAIQAGHYFRGRQNIKNKLSSQIGKILRSLGYSNHQYNRHESRRGKFGVLIRSGMQFWAENDWEGLPKSARHTKQPLIAEARISRWKDKIQNRPKNYDKIEAIIDLLKKNNNPITRQNILDELVDLPTNEDNQAIEFILGD